MSLSEVTKGKGKTASSEPINQPLLVESTASSSSSGETGGSLRLQVESATGLTKKQKELLKLLVEINGQDAYSVEAHTIGKLKREYWMRIPRGFPTGGFDASEVGSAKAQDRYTLEQLAGVFMLNYDAFSAKGHDEALKIALLRMEAAKMGWVTNQKEITVEDPPANAVANFVEHLAELEEHIEDARTLAFLMPMISEFIFRTRNHHYLSSQSAIFNEAYRRVMSACLIDGLHHFLPEEHLFYNAFHWVSPAVAYQVLTAQKDKQTIPDALTMRASAAPAGTAIIATTAAVIDAMDGSGIIDEMVKAKVFDPADILAMRDAIKENPTRYHKVFSAYGLSPIPADLKLAVDKIALKCQKFAPIAQGFIDGTMKNAALGSAMALVKHADQNPMTRKKAARFFSALSREKVGDVVDLLRTKLRNAEAVTE